MHQFISRSALIAMLTIAGIVHAAPTTWPNDADGDVFRRLQAGRFDFSREYMVDFNVDFTTWPPSKEAVEALRKKYSEISIVPPEGGDVGHIVFQIKHKLSYSWVIEIQRDTTEYMKPFGGRCESWGVLGP